MRRLAPLGTGDRRSSPCPGRTKLRRVRLEGLERLVNRPYYLYRPSQVLRRLQSMLPWSQRDSIVLPWGLRIDFDPGELLGRTLDRNGVYELAVSEFLFRLADRGELAVDVGANIGYMSSVLAASVGPGGQVRSFEPHPDLFRCLTLNTRAWEGEGNGGPPNASTRATSC
jgi:hypothetical protein